MKAVKWFLDLDNNVDDGENENTEKQQYSTAHCVRRYFPHHTHESLVKSFAEKGDIYAQVNKLTVRVFVN